MSTALALLDERIARLRGLVVDAAGSVKPAIRMRILDLEFEREALTGEARYCGPVCAADRKAGGHAVTPLTAPGSPQDRRSPRRT